MSNALIIKGIRRSDAAAWESLTPREQELCRRSTRGLTKREVAAEMGITRDTLRKHQKNVRKKIGWRADLYFSH